MDANGCARVTDFGFVTIARGLNSIRNASVEYVHGVQWIAPEILDGRGKYSKEGDIFSLAMVTVEVPHGRSAHWALTHFDSVSTQIFTGTFPFEDSLPSATALAILDGKRPPQPSHPTFTNLLWRLTQRCWNQEAHLRPQVSEVLQVLRSLCVSTPEDAFVGLTSFSPAAAFQHGNA